MGLKSQPHLAMQNEKDKKEAAFPVSFQLGIPPFPH